MCIIFVQMRQSPLLHPVAVLRTLIGLTQKELADICQCARRTIQSVELLTIPLSDRLALKISDETGVSLEWLLDGNCHVSPQKAEWLPSLCSDGKSGNYDKESFEKYRAFVAATGLVGPQIGRTIVPSDPTEFPRPEFYRSNPLELGRDVIDKADKLLMQACERVLRSTLDHKEGLMLRWHLKKFLITQCARYGVSVAGLEVKADETGEVAPPTKTENPPATPHQD